MRSRTILLIIASLLFVSACEQTETKYGTYQEVVRAGDMKKGWLPPFLPETAVEIREVHDIDNNQTWVRFKASITGLSDLSKALTPVALPQGCAGLKSREWWPTVLSQCDFQRAKEQLGVVFFKSNSEQNCWTGINFTTGDVFFWRTASP